MLKLYCQVKHLNLLPKWPFVNNSPSFERVQKDFPVKLDPREPKENRFAQALKCFKFLETSVHFRKVPSTLPPEFGHFPSVFRRFLTTKICNSRVKQVSKEAQGRQVLPVKMWVGVSVFVRLFLVRNFYSIFNLKGRNLMSLWWQWTNSGY